MCHPGGTCPPRPCARSPWRSPGTARICRASITGIGEGGDCAVLRDLERGRRLFLFRHHRRHCEPRGRDSRGLADWPRDPAVGHCNADLILLAEQCPLPPLPPPLPERCGGRAQAGGVKFRLETRAECRRAPRPATPRHAALQ